MGPLMGPDPADRDSRFHKEGFTAVLSRMNSRYKQDTRRPGLESKYGKWGRRVASGQAGNIEEEPGMRIKAPGLAKKRKPAQEGL